MDKIMDMESVIEELSHEKKLAIARFALEVAAADGEFADEEIVGIYAICSVKLGIDLDQSKLESISETEYRDVLSKFTEQEAFVLGLILGAIAQADGVVSFSELDHTRTLLEQTDLDKDLIPVLLEAVTNLKKNHD